MNDRACSEPQCGKPHRARGLCSTHYNQRQPHRHRRRGVGCAVCGTAVVRAVKSDRQPTCSIECRRRLQFGSVASLGKYDWATDAARRAQLAGATEIEIFDRSVVFERDGWLCYLCGRLTDPTADAFDVASPTVDHVLPLSRGGQHMLSNVRTACLACNSSKQDRTMAGATPTGSHGG